MAAVASVSTPSATSAGTTSKSGLSNMSSDDFMKILVTQLQYQDPMKPMDSEQMLSQISQIRNMEMSVTLTDSLRQLTDQQRFGGAAALIGKHVTGAVTAEDGTETPYQGIVTGVRVTESGEPIVELDTGESFPLKNLTGVADPSVVKAAATATGQTATGTTGTTSATQGA